jgi:TIGR03009 family protein
VDILCRSEKALFERSRIVSLDLAVMIAFTVPAPVFLDIHLAQWEAAMTRATVISTTFELTRTETTFKKERKYEGRVVLRNPDLVHFDSKNAHDPNDFETMKFDGKSIYHYGWKNKVLTEIAIVQSENSRKYEPFSGFMARSLRRPVILDLFQGFTAAKAKKRYKITQINGEDKNYIYLDIKPMTPLDAQVFSVVRLALYGPDVKPPHLPYLPAQVYVVNTNEDTDLWKFSNQQIDPKVDGKEIGPEFFNYEEPKGKGWTIRNASALPSGKNQLPKP